MDLCFKKPCIFHSSSASARTAYSAKGSGNRKKSDRKGYQEGYQQQNSVAADFRGAGSSSRGSLSSDGTSD